MTADIISFREKRFAKHIKGFLETKRKFGPEKAVQYLKRYVVRSDLDEFKERLKEHNKKIRDKNSTTKKESQ